MTADPVQLEIQRLRRVVARRMSHAVIARSADRFELSEAMGCTVTKLGRVLKGSSELSAVELILAARFLRFSVADIIGE